VMGLFLFLLKVFVISFSGAAQPGPVTATAIAAGSRSRYAGLLLAAGHGIIEFPLMILIILGLGRIFKTDGVQTAIGFVGGIILMIMAVQMFCGIKKGAGYNKSGALDKRPVLAGVLLSAGNPYFLLWWATVGLALAAESTVFGIWAFALFAVTHWLCDCLWLLALSWASFKGTGFLGRKGQRVILTICAAAVFVFGALFIQKAVFNLIKP